MAIKGTLAIKPLSSDYEVRYTWPCTWLYTMYTIHTCIQQQLLCSQSYSANHKIIPKVLWHVHELAVAVFLCLSMGDNMCLGVLATLSCGLSTLLTYSTHVIRQGTYGRWKRWYDIESEIQNIFCSFVDVSLLGNMCNTVGGHVGLCILCKVKLMTVNMTTWYDS